MGKIILVEGEPGTGKSRAIKSLDPNKTLIVKPNSKDLPFKGARTLYNKEKGNVVVTKDLHSLKTIIQKVNEGTKFNVIVIEDLTHFWSHRVMKESAIKGYDKWTILGMDSYNALISIEDELRDDLYIIIIGHTQRSENLAGDKVVNLQTPGKLLEQVVKIPSHVTYILHTDVRREDDQIKYRFITNDDGSGREAKSPEGCLNLLEENDYQLIINKIEKYQK